MLQNDINTFISQGVAQENIYVLSHDDERTKRILDDVNANTIELKDMEFGNAISSIFQKKRDQLRSKLQEVGFSESESEILEEDMDQGKVLLIITKHDPGNLFL